MQKLAPQKICLSLFCIISLYLYTPPISAMQDNNLGIDNNPIVDDPTVDKALWDACEQGALELTKVLLKGRANPNASHEGRHALAHAAVWAKNEIVKLFIESKVDLSLDNPLPTAAAGNSSQVIQTLIDAKANVNARDSEGETALCAAIKWAHSFHTYPKIVTLLKAGADQNMPNMAGLTALELALNLRDNTPYPLQQPEQYVAEMDRIISLLRGLPEEKEEENQ
jgi:ankyrin repeat protein